MKKIQYLILTLGIFVSFGLASLPMAANAASTVFDTACNGNEDTALCQQKKDSDVVASVRKVINTLLYILGAVSVLIIIVGGVLYVVSGGDAASVKKAKDTIMYAVVGLVVAILAYAIVNFVISLFPATPVANNTTASIIV